MGFYSFNLGYSSRRATHLRVPRNATMASASASERPTLSMAVSDLKETGSRIQRFDVVWSVCQHAGDQRPLRRIAEAIESRPRRTDGLRDRRDHVTGYASSIDEQYPTFAARETGVSVGVTVASGSAGGLRCGGLTSLSKARIKPSW